MAAPDPRGPAGGYGATPYPTNPAPGGPAYNQGPPAGYQGPPYPSGLPLGGDPMGTGAPPAGAVTSHPGSPLSPAPHIGPYPPGVQPAATSPPGVDSPTYAGPVAPDYVHDDPNAKGPSPTAPPVEKMDRIAGYDNVTFDGAALPPPSYDEANRQPPTQRRDLNNVPVITEEEAREAMLNFVAENCCYGKGAAKEMLFRGLESNSAFHMETIPDAPSFPSKCPYCVVIIQSLQELAQHYSATHGKAEKGVLPKQKGKFACGRCARTFGYKKRMVNHMESEHLDIETNQQDDRSNANNEATTSTQEKCHTKSSEVSFAIRASMEEDIERHTQKIQTLEDGIDETKSYIRDAKKDIEQHTGHIETLKKQLEYHQDLLRNIKDRLKHMS